MEKQELEQTQKAIADIVDARLKKIKKNLKRLKSEQYGLQLIRDTPQLISGDLEAALRAIISGQGKN